MRLTELIEVTEDRLVYSNLAEDDAPLWDDVTTWAAGDTVIYEHAVWEAQAENVGKNPAETENVTWIRLRPTNLFAAFDFKRTTKAQSVANGEIIYEITPGLLCDTVALSSVEADTIRIEVFAPNGETMRDISATLIDTSAVVDWFTYHFEPVQYAKEYKISGLPIYRNGRVRVTITGSAEVVKVGRVSVGRSHLIGELLPDTEVALIDYSDTETDSFGDTTIIKRTSARRVTYRFTMPSEDVERVSALVERLNGEPLYAFGEGVSSRLGTSVYGIIQDFSVPQQVGRVIARLEMKGLT